VQWTLTIALRPVLHLRAQSKPMTRCGVGVETTKANWVARITQGSPRVCCPCALAYLDTVLLLRQQKWWQAQDTLVFSPVRARCGVGVIAGKDKLV
jgi:hypothetical protein